MLNNCWRQAHRLEFEDTLNILLLLHGLYYIYTARHTMIGRLILHCDTANHWENQTSHFFFFPINVDYTVMLLSQCTKMANTMKAVKNHVTSAVNFVATGSCIGIIEGSVLTHNQSTNAIHQSSVSQRKQAGQEIWCLRPPALLFWDVWWMCAHISVSRWAAHTLWRNFINMGTALQ